MNYQIWFLKTCRGLNYIVIFILDIYGFVLFETFYVFRYGYSPNELTEFQFLKRLASIGASSMEEKNKSLTVIR